MRCVVAEGGTGYASWGCEGGGYIDILNEGAIKNKELPASQLVEFRDGERQPDLLTYPSFRRRTASAGYASDAADEWRRQSRERKDERKRRGRGTHGRSFERRVLDLARLVNPSESSQVSNLINLQSSQCTEKNQQFRNEGTAQVGKRRRLDSRSWARKRP